MRVLNLLIIYKVILSCTGFKEVRNVLKITANGRHGKSTHWKTLDGKPVVLFAHQGENVLVPAHTLAAYEIAAISGAEYVEPDLVLTKDDVLVCFHDIVLKNRTDIESHPEYHNRSRNFTGLGLISPELENDTHVYSDWFVEDFTLAELQTLSVLQHEKGIRPQVFNGMFGIPTFQEFLDVIHKMTFKLNRTIGIIPELKHPYFHNRLKEDHFMSDEFLGILQSNGYSTSSNIKPNCKYLEEKITCPPVIVQSFDLNSLHYIRSQTDNMELMILVWPELRFLTYEGLQQISKVANYYCVYKEYLHVGVEAELSYAGNDDYNRTLVKNMGGFIPRGKFVEEAHRLGLKMSVFTVRDSREDSNWGCAIFPGCLSENKTRELFYFFDTGIDAVFIENIAESREIRREYEIRKELEAVRCDSTTKSQFYK